METDQLNTWIELSAGAYRANLEILRALVGDNVELAAVVKSNAYGHGWREIAGLAVAAGANSFAVHALEEALALRAAGFHQNILVMGPIPLAASAQAVAADLRLVLYNLEHARALAAAAKALGRPAKVHLKIETGTYRQGIEGHELAELLAWMRQEPALVLDGVYTHFANIEDTTDHHYAERQLDRYRATLADLAAAGWLAPSSPSGEGVRRHTACSAAILLFPETHFDLVRLGISQYGIWPSRETLLSFRENDPQRQRRVQGPNALRPVLSWKTRISQVKWVPPDAAIGYGCTYQTTRPTRLAILPIGYADGYDRALSNQAWVLVRGKRAAVRGRICMNLAMVDITDIPDAQLEDEVVLIGRQGGQEIKVDQLASLAATISYEFLARLSPTLPRRIVA